MPRTPPHAHWYQMRNSVFAGLVVAAVLGVWQWTGNVTRAITGLQTSVESIKHDNDGTNATHTRDLDRMEKAIVRDLTIDEARIAELERCACRS